MDEFTIGDKVRYESAGRYYVGKIIGFTSKGYVRVVSEENKGHVSGYATYKPSSLKKIISR